MGDRTWVHLTILASQLEQARPIIEASEGELEEPESIATSAPNTPTLIWFKFEECNYGNLSCEKALQQAGIPFDKAWGRGDAYDSGTMYNRYTGAGELAAIEVYDAGINPDIDELLKRIDEPDKLRQYIRDHKGKITPLPWDDQEEYGKRYRARQLIEPPR